MKRRTNLFYTTGPDSKFLTFSNYTEALTGNVISTDTKLFPSKFLCLKINGLNSNKSDENSKSSKEFFIDFLIRYYENKLAVIKDGLINSNNGTVEDLYPLSYLLEAICYITELTDDGDLQFNPSASIYLDHSQELSDTIGNLIDTDKLKEKDNVNIIKYIGDISEEDYNGTYTDIICYIDMNMYKNASLVVNHSNIEATTSIISDGSNYLHGWEGFSQDFNDYNVSNIIPIYDQDISYNRLNCIDSLEVSDNSADKLEFNVIIPLFDIVDINYNTNNTTVIENNSITIENASQHNLPLGIWIYADKDKDTFITLEKDTETGMYPSWSLLISTQFKPFPYSNKIVNNANSSLLGNSFSTFSEVLTRMNMLLDKFTQIEFDLNALKSKISILEKQRLTDDNIMDLKQKIDAYKKSSENDIEELKNQILSYISNLKWSSVG